VLEAQVELLASLKNPSKAGSLWWPQMSLLGFCGFGFGFVVFLLSQGTSTLQFVISLQNLHHIPFIMGLTRTPFLFICRYHPVHNGWRDDSPG
jgi:hypothetical protein